MDLEAIFIYCLCADTFNALNLKEDQQAKMHCAEIATFVIISALYYHPVLLPNRSPSQKKKE